MGVQENHSSTSLRSVVRNKAKDKVTSRARYLRNKVTRNEQNKLWWTLHPAKAEVKARRHALRTYGLTLEDYSAMVFQQSGLCKSCGELPIKDLVVDHNHQTKKVRGLLCTNCNCALGHLKEDVDRCYKLIQYILSNAD